MSEVKYVLYESAAGYFLGERMESDEIGTKLEDVQQSVTELGRFTKVMKMIGFQAFTSAEIALENINEVSEGIMPTLMKDFLEMNLPKIKPGKKAKWALGVQEPKIGGFIQETTNIPCVSNDYCNELIRGVRMHFTHFVKGLQEGNIEKAQLGLGHSYSRSKVKFDVNRADKHIIQSIALLDLLDKDINTFAMRVREWYSWHFPELVKVVNDNYIYARLVLHVKRKESLNDESVKALEEITMDGEKAQQVVDAAKMSMGMDISDIDLHNIHSFAQRVIKLAEYRKTLQDYLHAKMMAVAPNLASLIGDQVGARLISHAGSLTNLSKYPASTVQILGAEKALFRALKTRGNTPKYGLIYHSSFIGRASAKNKGRISRYLANKCSIASRIDSFSEVPTDKFGEKLKEQVEERLKFYDTGAAPRKNIDVMKEVIASLEEANGEEEEPKKKKKDKKKKEKEEEAAPEKKKKKDKKKAEAAEEAPPEKKKKKKAEAEPEEGKKKKKQKV